MIVLGADIGSKTLGWGRVDVDLKAKRFNGALDCGALELEKATTETLTHCLKRRAWSQALHVMPQMHKVGAVVAECLILSSKGIGATAGAAMCWGMLVGLCAAMRIPLYEARTPWWQHQLLRTKGKAVDQETLERVMSAFINRGPASTSYQRIPHAQRTHARDGVGIAVVGSVRLATMHRVSSDIMV